MKKNKTKHIQILPVLIGFFLIGISLWSCDAEQVIIENTNKGFIIRKCSMKDPELQSNEMLKQANNYIKRQQTNSLLDISNSRLVYEEKTGLYYDDEKGIYVSKDGKESYTFPIIQNDENEKIINITFNKNSNNQYDIYLVKYDYSKEDLNHFSKEILSERVVKYQPILKNGIEYPIEVQWVICFTETIVVEVWTEQDIDGTVRVCVSTIETTTCESGGGVGPSGSSGPGVGPGNSNGPGLSVGNVPGQGANPNTQNGNTIITAAVTGSEYEGQIQEKTPCEVLNEQTINNHTFETKLDSLKQRVLSTNPNPDTTETAIAIKKTINFAGNDTITYRYYNENVIANGAVTIKSETDVWDIACMHNHPENTLPIFSNIDIVDLFISYNYVMPQRKNEYTSYLVCFNGATYALRMANLGAFTQLFQGLNLDTPQGRKDAEDLVMKIYKKKGFSKDQTYTQEMAENLFFDVLNDPRMGGGNALGLYRRDETGWGKLTKSGNSVQKEDCN
jgi:hypothetical protein